MTDEEAKLLQEKLDFANKSAEEAVDRYFEQQKKMTALYKEIAEADVKCEREVAKAVKAAKLETEKATVARVCDDVDDYLYMGESVYECTDRIRKKYMIPTKYGY